MKQKFMAGGSGKTTSEILAANAVGSGSTADTGYLDEIEKSVLRNLIADNWQEFVAECGQYDGVEPEDLYAKVGGEKGDH